MLALVVVVAVCACMPRGQDTFYHRGFAAWCHQACLHHAAVGPAPLVQSPEASGTIDLDQQVLFEIIRLCRPVIRIFML